MDSSNTSHYLDSYTASYAVVIGIDHYIDARFSPLGEAERDAREMARLLEAEPYGFRVTLLLGEDATRDAILAVLKDLKSTDVNDRILFYFAGHGYVLQDIRGNEVGFLGCSDTEPDDPFGGLEFADVTKLTRFARAKHIAFVLDTCFSGAALGLTRSLISYEVENHAAIKAYHHRRAYQMLTAGGLEAVNDARSMTSELVKVLREGLPGTHGPLTFGQIGQYVQNVIHNTSGGLQSPICTNLVGGETGQMVLFEPHLLHILPADMQAALTNENPEIRRWVIAEAEKLLLDPQYSDVIREYLEKMQTDDEDIAVRRRAMTALREAGPSLSRFHSDDFEPVTSWSDAAQKTPEFNDSIFDILPAPFEWSEIPGNSGFAMLTDEGNKGIYKIEPFYMSRYLVTYEQFQVFIDAEDGYFVDEWWEGLSEHPSQPDTQFFVHTQNLPRDQVNWYEAVAFCRWLSSHVGYEVRLPTEWEWQWAAQGDDSRQYPWGNEFVAGSANIDEIESGIRGGVFHESTTPVGSYPHAASPFGVLDMTGNVWEWCLNKHGMVKKIDTADEGQRVLRGGSWCDNIQFARTSFRDAFSPFNRRRFIGFRIAAFIDATGW